MGTSSRGSRSHGLTVWVTLERGMTGQSSASNTSTLAGYEGCAVEYAETTAPKPGGADQPALL